MALDEMPTPETVKLWREMYDPDLSHLINSHVLPLPNEIWRPQDLRVQDLMLKVGVLHADYDEATLSERYQQIQFDSFDFLLWSKYKLKEKDLHAAGTKAANATHGDAEAKAKAEATAIDEALLAAFKKRFERSLPLSHLNVIFVENSAAHAFLASHHTTLVNATAIDGSVTHLDGSHAME